jgi:hypothetical protein
MFLKTYYLINKNPHNFETKINAVINFMNEEKHDEFLNSSNKRFWLKEELNLSEDYFFNTYMEEADTYIAEIDNEYLIDKELQQADKFDIK